MIQVPSPLHLVYKYVIIHHCGESGLSSICIAEGE